MKPALPLDDKLERDWDRDLFSKNGLATLLGWQSHWTFLSKGSRAGFPDRTLCRDRIIFTELKREVRTATPLTEPQREWLDRLARAGGEVYLWRPSDLEEIAKVLSRPWLFQGWSRRLYQTPVGSRETEWWTPGSLWMPGIGRLDSVQGQEAA